MDLQAILFSFNGRIPRKTFWLFGIGAALVLGALSAGLMTVAIQAGAGAFNPMTGQFRPAGGFAVGLFILSVAETWIGLALAVKRLHDRDRTGAWIAAQWAAVVAAIALASITMAMPEWQKITGAVLSFIVGCIAVGLTVWLFVETSFLRGTPGDNRFGHDPLLPHHSDAAF